MPMAQEVLLLLSCTALLPVSSIHVMPSANSVSTKLGDFLPELADCYGIECLKRYVAIDDGAFSWKQVGGPKSGSTRGVPWTSYKLDMTSQKWRSAETGKAAWKHNVTVIVPDDLVAGSKQAGWGVLYINDGKEVAIEFAIRTGAVAAHVSFVPNEKFDFADEPRGVLPEETLKAWSSVQYAGEHHDHPEYMIELPSAKATVKSIDAVEAFTRNLLNKRGDQVPPVTRWAVTGVSKRAVATWHAAAVDSRIQAIVPVVECLNQTDGNARYSLKSLGGLSAGLKVYEDEGVYALSKEDKLRMDAIADPLWAAKKLTIPKLIMNAGWDDYFMPDQTRFWWSEVPEPKMFFMVGDLPHTTYSGEMGLLQGVEFYEPADAFINGVILEKPAPQIRWTIDKKTGDIKIHQLSDHKPIAVRLWQAHSENDKKRDFRLRLWRQHLLEPISGENNRTWIAHVDTPKDKFTAFYVAFEYEGPRPGGAHWKMTTEVSVVPNTFPFADLEKTDYGNKLISPNLNEMIEGVEVMAKKKAKHLWSF